MPIPLDSFFLHSAWATERLIDVCKPLSDDQLDAVGDAAYGSIRRTFVHMLSAEQYYLSRLERELPAERVTDSFPGWKILRGAAHGNGAAFARATSELSPEDTVQGGESDGFVTAAASVFLMQGLSHSAEHRAQIMSMLGALGAGPPDLDATIDGWSWGSQSGTLIDKSS